MSLWCPYIKANYCFLWSCNKYILRHPVAKGADWVQERTRKHVFLVTGKGPQQHRVSQPGIPQLSLRPLLLHQSEERGKGLAPFLGTAPQTKRLKAGFVVGDQKSHGCSSLCSVRAPSGLWTLMASTLPVQCVAEQWDSRLPGAITAKLPACHGYPWMCALSGKLSGSGRNLSMLLKTLVLQGLLPC